MLQPRLRELLQHRHPSGARYNDNLRAESENSFNISPKSSRDLKDLEDAGG